MNQVHKCLQRGHIRVVRTQGRDRIWLAPQSPQNPPPEPQSLPPYREDHHPDFMVIHCTVFFIALLKPVQIPKH